MYYFYVLQSQKDNQYYYGSTTDLKRRVKEHNSGDVTATKYRQPLRLVYYEAYEELQFARLREKQVKKSSSIRTALNKRITRKP
jgi:putative endonuclease